jgi:hypothetical protein
MHGFSSTDCEGGGDVALGSGELDHEESTLPRSVPPKAGPSRLFLLGRGSSESES